MNGRSIETKRLPHPRLITHLLLGSALVVLYLIITRLVQGGRQIELLVIVLGYLSLGLACVSLLIGPLSLLRWRHRSSQI